MRNAIADCLRVPAGFLEIAASCLSRAPPAHRPRLQRTDLWAKPKPHTRQLKLPKQKVRSICELPSWRAEASLLPQTHPGLAQHFSPELARGTANSSVSCPCPRDTQSSAAFSQLTVKPRSSGSTLWTSQASLTKLEILSLPLKSLRKMDYLAF